MKLGSNAANTPAQSAEGLTCGTLHVPNQVSIHMSVYHSIPTLCVEYVAALEAPNRVVVHELVQAYGTLTEVDVTDDGRRCRWPDTRLTLQGGFTSLEPSSGLPREAQHSVGRTILISALASSLHSQIGLLRLVYG
eukprot:6272549-Pyramimonas_sp.AAC.1